MGDEFECHCQNNLGESVSRLTRSIRTLGGRFLYFFTFAHTPSIALGLDQFAAAFAGKSPAHTFDHVLVAPPGRGNVGDFALVEAFLDNVPGRVLVISNQPDDFPNLVPYGERITIVALPGLLYGNQLTHLAHVTKFARLISGAKSVSVVGADIMDGAYNRAASVRRSVVAHLAARRGKNARILGFSWNGKAYPPARKALIAAGTAGVRVFLRDPISFERASVDGLTSITQAADMVFAAPMPEAQVGEDLLTEFGIDKRPFAIINVSGLIANKFDQTAEFTAIINHFSAMGLHVLLLPHVSKPKVDDVAACRKVMEQSDSSIVSLAPRLLSPREVRALANHATYVVTGRMHLSIMSLMNGTPAITLATQGKVEGLMQMFQLDDFTITPVRGFGSDVISVIERVRPDISAVRSHIAERAVFARELAQKNFDGLAQ
jgi:colanic acid/amylovoran biosynthesis protein